MDALGVAEAELVGNEQRHHGCAEAAPLLGAAHALRVEEGIEDTHVGAALSWIVLQVEQLETGHVRGAEIHLDVLLVEAQAPLSAGLVESLGLVGHARLFQPVAENLHVVGVECTGVFRYLVIVRVGLELGRLVRDDGYVDQRASLLEVHPCVGVEVVDHTPICRIGKGERAARVGAVTSPTFAAYATGDEEVHAGFHALIAQVVVGTECVNLVGRHRAEVLNQFGHLGDASAQFIAKGKHTERGVVGIFAHDSLAFGQQELHQHGVLGVHIAPERQFGLQVDAAFVSRHKGSFGRTPRMEAHVVEAILLAHGEVVAPRIHVHRHMPRQWPHASIVLSAQVDGVPACKELLSFNMEILEGRVNGYLFLLGL